VILRVVLIAVILGVAAAFAVRALARYDAKLGGKGNAQAPGSPAWAPVRHAAVCGVHGPAGLTCDLPPHGGAQHEQDGMGWVVAGGRQ